MRRRTIATLTAALLLAAACSADTTSDAASSSGPDAPAPAPAPDGTAPEPAPQPPTPGPAPEPEPREGDPPQLVVDALPELEWRTDCNRDVERRAVTLSPAEEGETIPPMRPGGPQFEHVDDPTRADSMRFTVDLSVVAELTLGGVPALAVDTSCFLGNGFMFAVEVWSVDEDGWPVQLPPAVEYSKTDGYVIDLAGEGDVLVVTMRVGAPGQTHPHLDGYPFVRITEHRFDGSRWSATVRSEVEVQDA